MAITIDGKELFSDEHLEIFLEEHRGEFNHIVRHAKYCHGEEFAGLNDEEVFTTALQWRLIRYHLIYQTAKTTIPQPNANRIKQELQENAECYDQPSEKEREEAAGAFLQCRQLRRQIRKSVAQPTAAEVREFYDNIMNKTLPVNLKKFKVVSISLYGSKDVSLPTKIQTSLLNCKSSVEEGRFTFSDLCVYLEAQLGAKVTILSNSDLKRLDTQTCAALEALKLHEISDILMPLPKTYSLAQLIDYKENYSAPYKVLQPLMMQTLLTNRQIMAEMAWTKEAQKGVDIVIG